VSVDTVIDQWKAVCALGANRAHPNAVELNGQVVRYDAARSQLTLRDPMSPKSVSLRITPSTWLSTGPARLAAGLVSGHAGAVCSSLPHKMRRNEC
jgi:hypothetical protein